MIARVEEVDLSLDAEHTIIEKLRYAVSFKLGCVYLR